MLIANTVFSATNRTNFALRAHPKSKYILFSTNYEVSRKRIGQMMRCNIPSFPSSSFSFPFNFLPISLFPLLFHILFLIPLLPLILISLSFRLPSFKYPFFPLPLLPFFLSVLLLFYFLSFTFTSPSISLATLSFILHNIPRLFPTYYLTFLSSSLPTTSF